MIPASEDASTVMVETAPRAAEFICVPSVGTPDAADPNPPPFTLWSPLRNALKGGTRARTGLWMLHDFVVAAWSMIICYYIAPKYPFRHTYVETFGMLAFASGILVGGNICALYERQALLSVPKMFVRLGLTVAVGVLFLLIGFSFLLYAKFGRWPLVLSGLVFFLLAGFPRYLINISSRVYKNRVLFIGDSASMVFQRLRTDTLHHHLVGFIDDKGMGDSLGVVDDIPEIAKLHDVDEIVVATDYMSRRKVLDRCFEAVRHERCHVTDECTFHEQVFEEVAVDEINEAWFHSSGIGLSHLAVGPSKRVMDIAMAVVGLILTAPLMAVVWLLVRLTSPGPAIYTQTRCGQFGKPFQIYKFRSMRNDAESGKAIWATTSDPRVTPIGAFLRRTRLDEIPQFWNVLKGDMSIVGPRPERPELVDEIELQVPFFAFRHWVRPGLTGLAQIRFRYAASASDARIKLQYDLYYIKNLSVILDIQIILRTFTALMRGSR